MAINQTRRLSLEVLRADHMTLVALHALADYHPHNPAHTAEVIAGLDETIRTGNTHESARNGAIAAEWAVHNALLGAKAQVIAQYGTDSDAVQSLGLKRKSERKRPTRRKIAPGGPVSG